jgi:hypothetical protein
MEKITDFFGHEYTRIIKDPAFETRLKNFDPNLRLMFDQTDKNFKILERRTDNSGWNIIVSLQPGEELDDNIMNLLWVRRQQFLQKKIDKNPKIWFDNFLQESENVRQKLDDKSSQDHRYRLAEDRNEWRKAWRELNNMPAADVTAGYRKIEHKPKGIVWNKENHTG